MPDQQSTTSSSRGKSGIYQSFLYYRDSLCTGWPISWQTWVVLTLIWMSTTRTVDFDIQVKGLEVFGYSRSVSKNPDLVTILSD